MKKFNPLKEKIILLLMAGVALSFTYSPYRQRKIFKGLVRGWKQINEKKLKYEINNLNRSGWIKSKKNSDGSFSYLLTNKGKLKATHYYFKNIIKNKVRWDGKYRLVMFDIPEKFKKERDRFRHQLKEFGFYELQKSVFVFPLDCKKEINFLIDFFNFKDHVNYGILELENDDNLRKFFKL